MQILINQISYRSHGPKVAIVQSTQPLTNATFTLADTDGTVVLAGPITAVGTVAHWHTGTYGTIDFSAAEAEGKFQLTVKADQGTGHSARFTIDHGYMDLRLISAMTYWFKGQRADGEWAAHDQHAEFMGAREGTWNVAGGWFDATGDVGVHLSHQSHTAYYNPQQMAFSAYAFYQLTEQLAHGDEAFTIVKRRILAEASYGADSVMHRFVPTRAFIKSIDRPSAYAVMSDTRQMAYELHHSSDQFGEAATAAQETVTDLNYETSFRSGGGSAIATLAIAGRHYYPGAEYTSGDYIQTAKQAYRYLKAHNNELTNDGKTNLVDAYCALLATVELYKTTEEYGYLLEARDWATQIENAVVTQAGYPWLTVDQEMPFTHPADEGLPLFALALYAEFENEPQQAQAAQAAAKTLLESLIAMSDSVNNPFDYARIWAKDNPQDALRTQFFFPHHTAAAPWWQGENARLASLATAAFKLAATTEGEQKQQFIAFGQAQLDWIEGRNPFDSAMIEGFGRNHIQYHFGDRVDFLNAPGGIVNGITSGIDDEQDIAFVRGPEDGVDDNWRWAEQWLPHVSWMLLALGQKSTL